jgi:hypothetical protein
LVGKLHASFVAALSCPIVHCKASAEPRPLPPCPPACLQGHAG